MVFIIIAFNLHARLVLYRRYVHNFCHCLCNSVQQTNSTDYVKYSTVLRDDPRMKIRERATLRHQRRPLPLYVLTPEGSRQFARVKRPTDWSSSDIPYPQVSFHHSPFLLLLYTLSYTVHHCISLVKLSNKYTYNESFSNNYTT